MQHPTIPHFVMTRMGLGIHDPDWYRNKLELFAAITLPSLGMQTHKAFHWLIMVDALMPPEAKMALEKLLEPFPHFHLVPVDATTCQRMTFASHDWAHDAARHYILKHDLIPDIGQYYLSSSMDDDDAWHRQTLETVQKMARNFLNEHANCKSPDMLAIPDRRWQYAHTDGVLFTFPNGLEVRLAEQEVTPMSREYINISCFLLTRFSSGLSVILPQHSHWSNYADALFFNKAPLYPSEPMWVYIRHRDNVSHFGNLDYRNKIKAFTQPMNDKTLELLQGRYGINAAGLANYIRNNQQHKNRGADWTQRHNQTVPALQLGGAFRIATLNAQITALTERRDELTATGQPTDALASRLAQVQAERDRQITDLKQRGQKVLPD